MRYSRIWSLVAIAAGIAAGAMLASSNAVAQSADYCERDECINWSVCWDNGVLPLGCDKVYGSPHCQTYFCGQT